MTVVPLALLYPPEAGSHELYPVPCHWFGINSDSYAKTTASLARNTSVVSPFPAESAKVVCFVARGPVTLIVDHLW